jgi:UPF0716 family protein affecting phage T7 exclusion
MKNLLYNIVPLAFIALAGVLAVTNRDGWGWCLFLALITAR